MIAVVYVFYASFVNEYVAGIILLRLHSKTNTFQNISEYWDNYLLTFSYALVILFYLNSKLTKFLVPC